MAELLVGCCRTGHRLSGPRPRRGAALTGAAHCDGRVGVVRLTDAPLDLDNPAHLNALERAYERFREIGGRSTP
ncbi:MAG TPA: DUF5953 family protein [Archangium sp.]|nr:DUF5953 family protein [Archangium sp.]